MEMSMQQTTQEAINGDAVPLGSAHPFQLVRPQTVQGVMPEAVPLAQVSHDDPFDRNSDLCLNGRIIRLGDYAVEGGGYADVWQGRFESQMVAIKVTRPFGNTGMQIKQSKLLRRLWREYLAWSSLSHPNVLECLGFSYDFSSNSFVPSLVSPWMANGTVLAYLDKCSDIDCLELLLGIADGLSYLHSHDPAIVHGDIRAGNVLVSDSGIPCIGDFGLSRVLSEVRGMTTSSEPGGSVRWMAPELLNDDTSVSVHSDVWAYGMTILEIFSGERPYSTLKREAVVLDQIRHGRIPSRPEGTRILPDDIWSICQHCWRFDPTQRLPMPEVISKLHHHRNRKSVEGTRGLSSSASATPIDIPELLVKTQPGCSNKPTPCILGVCAMDIKARSKAMREILTRLKGGSKGYIDIKLFGDKVILDEDVENWPRCNVFISFYSVGFPLWKAISYVKLRQPYCINDLALQSLLLDRRLVGAVLDHLNIPTPQRIIVSRDGGPTINENLRKHVRETLGLQFGERQETKEVTLREDGNAIIIDGHTLEKPFLEKPVSGEDHNVYIYFRGGGGRRLFRKIGNRSSEMDPDLLHPRTEGSYIYEEFIDMDQSEDIKVYTLGTGYTHAETRKSPVVDGVVRRNTDGNEIRLIKQLNEEEKLWATKIVDGFGQRVCGFDLLRCEGGAKSLVIDVNGWSFVKGNHEYYDKAAGILADICFRETPIQPPLITSESTTQEANTWLLEANVTVFRHADRTPKEKLKFEFPTAEPWAQPLVTLLKGETKEVIFHETEQLRSIANAVTEAITLGASGDDLQKLQTIGMQLERKINLPGTKVQLKPGYSRRAAGGARNLVRPQLVFKWGGESTHAANYQSRDLGENVKKDIMIMNKELLNNVTTYTSSERRVISSAGSFTAAFLPQSASGILEPFVPPDSSLPKTNGSYHPTPDPMPRLVIREDLLADSNVAKDLMDDVKKRLKILLRPGELEKRPDLSWSKNLDQDPVRMVKEITQLLRSFRNAMRRNFQTLDIDKIQQEWCCGDEPWFFVERWEKLFEKFCDVEQEKFDPSHVSELYDTIKYCALHHRTFLFAMFDEQGDRNGVAPEERRLHELYGRAKALFDLVAPQEYGIKPHDKEEIGILTSLPLLRKVVKDLETARMNGGTSLTTYFTKESHIYTLVNLVLLSGLPIARPRIPELDYASHITFELYKRTGGRGKSDKEYSIKISLSEGAHSSNVLDSLLDARHCLKVQPRRMLTQHLDYSLVIEKLSKHFDRIPED